MARFELKLPKMGESVAEATITSWLKEVGDTIELDEAVVEIATDKVDSEVPSEVAGTLLEILYQQDDIVAVGETIAIIEVEGEDSEKETVATESIEESVEVAEIEKTIEKGLEVTAIPVSKTSDAGKFYSPLVRSIAQTEGIAFEELETIVGSGKEGRVTKEDILKYIKEGRPVPKNIEASNTVEKSAAPIQKVVQKEVQKEVQKVVPVSINGEDEIIEMSRMGKLVSKHMVSSIQTAAHVQSFIEIDVTNIVKWRTRVKDAFHAREGEKLTFTPILMHAVAATIRKYPMINIAMDGTHIIKKKNINLGMAASLPDGNLIVPVIKNADQLNLVGMTRAVNDLANRARNNALKPDDIQGGTYTVTNVGSFGSLMGTPIINQPQVAILALGAIRKVPAVIETVEGDFIGIRQKMFVSHSYDHRVVNGALGGMFIKTLKEILEAWDLNQDF
ncbi:putative dihydrolipoamide acetyltransferase [Polaribacter irgensii 23-P]|uniref:Dihydrolipoamide acetyltransferase component of pyruvate dehydrogenase complex n=1 Tax=Polaribacter irgensii 23-P TaxID=313594 RepID=A4BYX5_9FLAO|nr:dihydrolipoamide acetyltransferase family protein [Polaribacter irgensii]EAR12368.1 putative dihydrolipoamide acetyltransferase [Polaribacter irgensii 23-P]